MLKEPNWAQNEVAHAKPHIDKPKPIWISMLALPEKAGLGHPTSTSLLSTSSLTQPQGFPLLRIREEPALANQQTPSITSSFLLPVAYKPLALHSSSELLSICSIGYYPIHELLDKVNKICIIFLVEFCSLIV